MLSDSVYRDIWDGLLEVARATRYFSLLEQRCNKQKNVIRWLFVTVGCGIAAALFGLVPMSAIPILFAFIIVLSIVDFLINPSKHTAQLNIANPQLSNLEEQYRHLWEKARSGLVTDEVALNEKQRIMLEMKQICSFIDIGVNDKLNQIAQVEAFEVEEKRYA